MPRWRLLYTQLLSEPALAFQAHWFDAGLAICFFSLGTLRLWNLAQLAKSLENRHLILNLPGTELSYPLDK